MMKKMVTPMNVNKPTYQRTANYIMPKKNDNKINPKQIFDMPSATATTNQKKKKK